jgi:hypothetical protein
MQQRPIRSQLYLPVLRFGITDEDWSVVILASIAGHAIPFLLGWKIYAIPAELIGWLLLMGLSVLTLNLIRRKSRLCAIAGCPVKRARNGSKPIEERKLWMAMQL